MTIDRKSIQDKVQSAFDAATAAYGLPKSMDINTVLVTDQQLIMLANELTSMIMQNAISANVVPSVLANIAHIRPDSGIYRDAKGNRMINIGLDDGSFHRESLNPDVWSGIDNIILLINYGYEYKPNREKVRGMWHGAYIQALLQRSPTFFLEGAIESFNSMYAKWNVIATLNT